MRGKCVLVGGSVSLDTGFEVSELCTIPSVLYFFVLLVEGVSSQLPAFANMPSFWTLTPLEP